MENVSVKVIKLTPDIILIHADCFDAMPKIKTGKIDLILADLPYGTTRNKWDSVLPLDKLWIEYKRVAKRNAAIVLTAQTPFDKVLGCSNLEMLKYEWIWQKDKPTGHLNCNKMPLKEHENILTFYSQLPTYNPQMTIGKPSHTRGKGDTFSENYGVQSLDFVEYLKDLKYPKTILAFNKETGLHPTQKPVPLMEYIINTYTNLDEYVLDNTMGSGTTGVAAINIGRKFIGIEQNEAYFNIAVQRCTEALALQERKIAA